MYNMGIDDKIIPLENLEILNDLAGYDVSNFIENCQEKRAFYAEHGLDCPQCKSKPDYAISEDKWVLIRDFSQRRNALFLPSFEALVETMGLDGDPSTLSSEDVSALVVQRAAAQQRRTLFEVDFIQEYGLPEKIILVDSNISLPENTYAMVIMNTGEYYALADNNEIISTLPVDKEKGLRAEKGVADAVLKEMTQLFATNRHAAKNSVGNFSDGAPAAQTYLFGEQEYLLPNGRSRIAILPENELNDIFMLQPTNGCVAVTIINAAIEQGIIPKDWSYVLQAYENLGSGRVPAEAFATIPGVDITRIFSDNLQEAYEQDKSIMVVIPEFFSHAALITSVTEFPEDRIEFQFADPVTGMIQTKTTKTRLIPADQKEGASDELPVSEDVKEGLSKAISQLSIHDLLTQFYTVTISDPEAFITWLGCS